MALITRTANGEVTVDAGKVTIIAAIIAAVPPLATGLLDRVWATKAQNSSVETLKVERRKAATALLQAALANPDSSQRRALLEFLINNNIVDTTIFHGPLRDVPYWPTSP